MLFENFVRIGEDGEVWRPYIIGPQCVAVREGHTATRVSICQNLQIVRWYHPFFISESVSGRNFALEGV